MAEELVKQDDDAVLRGGNSTSATSTAEITNFAASQPGGNGQRSGNSNTSRNPEDTSARRWNPLARFSSYTYALSLYMLTPEAANYFSNYNELPEKDSDGRYIIVAQSGGINNNAEPRGLTLDPNNNPGPGKPGLDYYIDDLNIEIFLLGKDGQKTSTQATTFTFKVIEPIGFTFLTKLSNASKRLNELSPAVSNGDIANRPNLYQQHYMLGVKFYGYDANGKVVQISEVPESSKALNDSYALYERLFPLSGNKVTFKIDGRATVYNFEATLLSLQAALGTKRGFIMNQANLKGGTVGEILGSRQENSDKSLIGWLNAKQIDLQTNKNIEKPQWYDIKWGSDWFDAGAIKNSPMLTDAEYAKETAPMANIANVQQSNVSKAIKSNSIDTKSKQINIAAQTSIVSAIDQIIVKSKYVTDTLMKEINQRIQAQTNDNPKGVLLWYSIKPLVKIIGRDVQTKDWAYEISYEIVPYEIPYIKSQYVTARSKYYGPVKEYSYLLTGKNTEIISFEMSYDNSFYIITPSTTTKDDTGKLKTTPSTTPNAAAASTNSNATMGSLNSGGLIAETVRANLYSVPDQVIVSIKILGDPDFLMDSIGSRIQSGTFSKFYGKNHAVNPYGGQVFVEIIFKVAEDYKNNGLLDVDFDQTIGFYPKEVQSILGNKGIIYRINKVQSSFSRGRFEQVLDMVMVPVNELIITKDIEEQRTESRAAVRNIERNLESSSTVLPRSGERESSSGDVNSDSNTGEGIATYNPNTSTQPGYANDTANDDASTAIPTYMNFDTENERYVDETASSRDQANTASTAGSTPPPGP